MHSICYFDLWFRFRGFPLCACITIKTTSSAAHHSASKTLHQQQRECTAARLSSKSQTVHPGMSTAPENLDILLISAGHGVANLLGLLQLPQTAARRSVYFSISQVENDWPSISHYKESNIHRGIIEDICLACGKIKKSTESIRISINPSGMTSKLMRWFRPYVLISWSVEKTTCSCYMW